jgi:hypothetical protein
LDSLKIKISIFILFIRFNHSTCNARPIRPHKIKGVAHYYKLRAVGGQIVLTNVFYRFNVSQCTCRRWITTIINLHTPPSGPPPKCPLMPILIINKKIKHKQENNTHNPKSSTKNHQQQNKLHKKQNKSKQTKKSYDLP